MKKEWKAPELEVLQVSQTMAGQGTTYVDWSFTNGKLDLDITDTPPSPDNPAIPLPTIPGVPTS